MINKDNIKDVLHLLGFTENNGVFSKHFAHDDFYLTVDCNQETINYPEDKGFTVNERQTCNFSSNENFVVLECVHRLFERGYKPQHIELEPKWKLGHGASGGRADILVRNQQNRPLLLIECKTAGKEFEKAWKDTLHDGAQLFSYIEQEKGVEFVCLYASGFSEKENKISIEQRIISHKDNITILNDDAKLKGFRDAKNVKERYAVWKETYKLEYTEKGIFEENIQPYQIGKEKYTLDIDTKEIEGTDIRGRYHEFRTILRKYNVSRRENAFEVLVNLFLCKIVDETENPNDLKFYWKGIAYDNYFDLVDRLQELYKIGMDKFLQQEIIYISNEQIDKAFWPHKRRRNQVKKEIKEIFRQLKFYKGLDFEFIKVFNKEYFDKNAKVLLEIIQMWQGIRLKTDHQNQFLGDMFEFFLDNGIKQTEGQFFTPVPICKFIVMSLPLEQQIQSTKEPLRMIDFACGSGHFLTEYASQIKSLVPIYKNNPLADYYKNIYGIEKEDRLAKVSKVSAFMYGYDAIHILDADALLPHAEIKEQGFDVLVANPPFAVEDFLTNFEDEQLYLFEMTNFISDIGNKNIQCYFIERAKQLLTGNGTMGIIVPNTVLTNSDAMHVKTREIILQYFDIICITELGSNTFGKTGTNTVILFLRRKSQKPEPADVYKDRVEEFFENWQEEKDSRGGEYSDIDVVQTYCSNINVPMELYETLLNGNPSDELLETEHFKEYTKSFYNSTEIVNLRKKNRKQIEELPKTILKELQKQEGKFKKTNTRVKSKTSQSTETVDLENEVKKNLPERIELLREEHRKTVKDKLLTYLTESEKEKLYYYILAYNNPHNVLIIKSPSENKEQKEFLGYEWSGAKGSEGVHYFGGETVHDIQTPMFDPTNRHNPDKINYYIQKNFNGESFVLPEHLKSSIKLTRVVDLLDFSRSDFSKVIKADTKTDYSFITKWEHVKLGDLVETLNGLWTGKKLPFSKVTVIRNTNFKKNGYLELDNAAVLNVETSQYKKRKLEFGDIIVEKSGGSETQAVGRVVYFDVVGGNFSYSNFTCRLRTVSDSINSKYLFFYLYHFYELGHTYNMQSGTSGIKNLDFDMYLSIRIPVPPIQVQQKIVDECEAVDKAANQAQQTIKQTKKEIEMLTEKLSGKYEKRKVSEVAILNPSKKEIRNIPDDTIVSFVEMASVSEEGYITHKEDRLLGDLRKGSYTYFAENDIIIAKITPCMENGKCAIAENLTNGLAMGSTEFHVFRAGESLNTKYLFTLLNRDIVRKSAEQNFTGSSGHRRVPINFYENYLIPSPPLHIQEQFVKEVILLEKIIEDAKNIIQQAPEQKQKIMEKYL